MSLSELTRRAETAKAQAVNSFDSTIKQIDEIRALASKISDLEFLEGHLCSKSSNSSMTDFDTKVGCGCHPEPGDDVVMTPYTVIEGIKIHSSPRRIVIGREASVGMYPREGWKEELVSLGFRDSFIARVQQYMDNNPADSSEED